MDSTSTFSQHGQPCQGLTSTEAQPVAISLRRSFAVVFQPGPGFSPATPYMYVRTRGSSHAVRTSARSRSQSRQIKTTPVNRFPPSELNTKRRSPSDEHQSYCRRNQPNPQDTRESVRFLGRCLRYRHPPRRCQARKLTKHASCQAETSTPCTHPH